MASAKQKDGSRMVYCLAKQKDGSRMVYCLAFSDGLLSGETERRFSDGLLSLRVCGLSETAVSACFIRLLSLWPATVHFPCHYSPQWRQTVLGCGSCHVSVQLFELSDETVSGEPRFRWHGSLGFSETERRSLASHVSVQLFERSSQ